MMADLHSLLADLTSGDDERATLAAVLLSNAGEQALKHLQPLLSMPDPDTRWWAIRTLAEIRLPEVTSHLTEALKDKAASVRQCAALALQQQPAEESIPGLIDALSDRDSLVTRLAANALVAIGQPAVPALVEKMQTGAEKSRFEAARALALIGDPRSIPAFFTSYDEDSALMAYWADEALERMGVGTVFFKP